MRRTRIKFCGLTRSEDVDAAVMLGVDAIGLIFAERSPRRLTLAAAERLRERLPPPLAAVALLMDQDQGFVAEVVGRIRPTCLQFHGSESAEFCTSFDLPYLKAIPMAYPAVAQAMMQAHPTAAAFVLDSHAPGAAGGSGQAFDWQHSPRGRAQPIFLAGGLHAANVEDAIRSARPFAVDVASGIETAPGCKSLDAMRQFVDAVRRADTAFENEE